MSYLLWGHVIVWLALLIYAYVLLMNSRNLRKKIEMLKEDSFGYSTEDGIRDPEVSERNRVNDNA